MNPTTGQGPLVDLIGKISDKIWPDPALWAWKIAGCRAEPSCEKQQATTDFWKAGIWKRDNAQERWAL